MKNIVILSSSVRKGRASHRVALFFEKLLKSQPDCQVIMIDLMTYNFPIFQERLKFLENPSSDIIDFSNQIKNADGIILVTPEYNGGYPASLKNVVDLLYDEWKRKPIAIATVSGGNFGGAQVITSLLFSLWKIGAMVIPSHFPVPNVTKEYTTDGEAINPESTHKRAHAFIEEFFFWITRSSSN
ncbi:MAG: NADPH-dependent oxidoreductase [Pedobacter sp.]|nr:MAG: NADPH-dependent oxidoreductase [Pedobacter sp.]